MLSSLRRCSASLPRSLTRISSTSTSSSRLLANRTAASPLTFLRPAAARTLHQSAKWQQYQNAAVEEQAEEDDHKPSPPSNNEPVTKFADLESRGLVDGTVVHTIINQMKLEDMTEVQSATIHEALKGVDMLDGSSQLYQDAC
jgi:ATP-dependent RNA helicase MSS116